MVSSSKSKFFDHGLIFMACLFILIFLKFLQDVMQYVSNMPNQFRVYEVPYPKWNHLDYMWGIDADKYVYTEIIKDIADFQKSHIFGI